MNVYELEEYALKIHAGPISMRLMILVVYSIAMDNFDNGGPTIPKRCLMKKPSVSLINTVNSRL